MLAHTYALAHYMLAHTYALAHYMLAHTYALAHYLFANLNVSFVILLEVQTDVRKLRTNHRVADSYAALERQTCAVGVDRRTDGFRAANMRSRC